ncbi:MAG: hypothetical protein H6Q06_2284, partial [Acidobacteria bacterium]|nr:hypothetical protein [Acidobacteriota bacterium]
NAADVQGSVAAMTGKTVFSVYNTPVAVGTEAIRSLFQGIFSYSALELNMPVEDVRVVGDLAVARIDWAAKFTPKSQGVAPFSDSGSQIVVLTRQNDGSWKWEWTIVNSNQPLPGSTASGEDEQALYQIERDWINAMVKSDAAAVEPFIAKEWTYNADGQVMGKAQMIAEIKSGAYKLTSMELSELSPHVFGDVALVTGTMTMKGKYKGSDIPGPIRGTDFFVKRDGRWQVVSTQNITIK